MRHTIRIVVVDDSSAFRASLMGFLAGLPTLEVVGEARDGREAIEITRRLAPDVVIMDFVMPRMDGIAATRALKLLASPPRVILCTMVEDEVLQEMAREAGADAFLPKRETVARIEALLHAQPRPVRSAGWRS